MNHYRHVLFAVDFNVAPENAGLRAMEVARCHGAEITLLHVIDYFPEDIPNDWIPPEDADPGEYLNQRADQALEDLAERIDARAARRRVVLSEVSAARAIVRYVQDNGVDIVVLGRRSGHGEGLLLGSTSEAVLRRAPCDLLVVQTG